MVAFGERYLFGDGVEKNIPEAEKIVLKALELGDGEAASLLGRFYYKSGQYEKASQYFYIGINRHSENAKNNLAFMIRRNEVPSYSGDPTVDELLTNLVKEKDLYATINYALCFASGFQRLQDWHKADEFFISLSEMDRSPDKALQWWNEFLISHHNDPEGHLVVGWLSRHGYIQDPDNLSVKQRVTIAREGGWNVPDWMESVIS
jgi:TPR repeat protein